MRAVPLLSQAIAAGKTGLESGVVMAWRSVDQRGAVVKRKRSIGRTAEDDVAGEPTRLRPRVDEEAGQLSAPVGPFGRTVVANGRLRQGRGGKEQRCRRGGRACEQAKGGHRNSLETNRRVFWPADDAAVTGRTRSAVAAARRRPGNVTTSGAARAGRQADRAARRNRRSRLWSRAAAPATSVR